MQIPNIMEYEDFRVFFEDFVVNNKARKHIYTYRFLAKKLGWPISYLRDLIGGRRNLTVPRALQFAAFARMDAFDTERLVFMALRDSDSPLIKDYFADKLKKTHSQRRYDDPQNSPPDLLELDVLAVYNILQWAKIRLPSKTILGLLYALPELTNSRVDEIVRLLIKRKVVTVDKNKRVTILKERLALDMEDAADESLHRQYAESFVRFCNVKKKPYFYSSAIVHLPEKRFVEIVDKFVTFRNAVMEQSAATLTAQDLPRQERLPFQFMMNLVPMIDADLADKLGQR